MVLPIYLYGQPVLRKATEDIAEGEMDVKQLVADMWETLAAAEGCLSLPGIWENVVRPETITIKYQDIDFKEHTETLSGFAARIVQHEYDHLEAHVFTDRISPIRRQFCKNKLTNIAKGKVSAKYRTKH